MAIRGEVLDIFSTDAKLPAPVDIHGWHDHRDPQLRSGHPTQPGLALQLGIERASELPLDHWVTILDHFKPGTIVFSDRAEARRRRFLELSRDVAQGQMADIDAIDEELWRARLAPWRVASFGSPGGPVPRFASVRRWPRWTVSPDPCLTTATRWFSQEARETCASCGPGWPNVALAILPNWTTGMR